MWSCTSIHAITQRREHTDHVWQLSMPESCQGVPCQGVYPTCHIPLGHTRTQGHSNDQTGTMWLCRCDADSVVVLLEVKALNMKAIQLYMKYGFVEVGLRRKYYDDGSDALLMARQPGQGLLLPAKP